MRFTKKQVYDSIELCLKNNRQLKPQKEDEKEQEQLRLKQIEKEQEERLRLKQMEKEQEHWVKAYWRPAMGWLYMVICFMDFVGFPAITMFLPVIEKGFGIQMGYTPWVSLTLSNGGLIHMAFGAILGVAAYGRTQEKVQSKQ